jgi:phosphoglycerate dehydrogenase-like enzyme
MKNTHLMVLMVAALFSFANGSRAEISIDKLVEQSRLAEGDVAVSEMPRWNGASKILVWDIGMDLSDLYNSAPDVEFIVAESAADAMQHASAVDAIIGFCSPELIAAAKKLVWVQIYWAGAERCLTVDAVADGTVVMSNMQKMSSPVIAEHAIAMMMALSRNLPQFINRMEDGDWSDGESATDGMMPIAGKKMLVAGLGGIGTEVARLGNALGMSVSGTRNSSRNGPDFVEYVGLSHELSDLAASADVIVNALPATDATMDLFDAEFFSKVKTGAIFINVGRGQTVVTDDLIAALESGQISGAGLDVTAPEPLPADNPLWQRDDVIITPHISSSGGELERHSVLLRENVRRYIAGEPLLNVVDPKKGY